MSHRSSSFLFTYQITPHASTNTTPSELFFEEITKDLLRSVAYNVETVVCLLSQAKQKSQHDMYVKERAFNIGQGVLTKKFCSGTKWVPGTITQRLGPVTYLVKVKNDLTYLEVTCGSVGE